MNAPRPSQSILVVDDDRSALSALCDFLEMDGHHVIRAGSGSEALSIIESTPLDLVLTDLRMQEVDGLHVLEASKTAHPDVPVIVMTAFASMETTIDAIRSGAYDYISKPFKLDHVRVMIRRALEQAALLRENAELRTVAARTGTEADIVGQSPEMVEVYKVVARVAPLPTTVLLQGESGTGKERIAQLLHRTSSRNRAPFRAINCGALPETLLESELFGYTKGAFTGASSHKAGLFESADTGTCFLDEISNTTAALQMRLLRVLEEREVTRVGSTEPIKVDVRIIAATNRPLADLVKECSFREDLYYRLKVVTIDLPPLRHRRGDIPLLLEHFVRRYASDSEKAMAVHESLPLSLCAYSWPGNVRELENSVERAIALNSSGVLTLDDFPEEVRNSALSAQTAPKVTAPAPSSAVAFKTLEEKELEYIQEVLAHTGDNASRAAEILGIDRRTLYRILERHGIRRGGA